MWIAVERWVKGVRIWEKGVFLDPNYTLYRGASNFGPLDSQLGNLCNCKVKSDLGRHK
jgi:hypothetical protein